jgi:uncharacterized protein
VAPFGLALYLALGAFAACERAGEPAILVTRDAPLVPVDTGIVEIRSASDTVVLRVEIAETPRQTSVGLMERHSMPPDEGMIFLFDEPRTSPFWMYRTHIPLDIAFLDEEGRIVAIRQMEPCPSPNPQFCPQYEPGRPYVAALEANLGFFASRGIGVGDRVVLHRAEMERG